MAFLKTLTTPNGIKYTQPTGLFINGEFVASKSGKTFESISPSTEQVITEVQYANDADVDAAVDAAEAAQEAWAEMDPDDRATYMFKLAAALEEKYELLAAIDSWDNGKPYSAAKGEAQMVARVFRNYAGWANKNHGDVIETDNNHFSYTRHEPIGVCGMVIPWNYPLMMVSWKIAPAMACGNTSVLKAAESTPLSALAFAKICQDVGIPKGVVNIVTGFGDAGAAIANHPRIKKVAFTGSTATGRKIMESSAKTNLKKITLELGGKSANIVFDDADIENAIESTLNAIFSNQGEVCCAGSRLLIQEGIHDKFLSLLAARAEKLKVGDPFDKDVYYGAQTNKTQFEKVLEYIETGKKEGARLVTGGERIGDKGFFLKPTIFADVEDHHTIAHEEIFGPVLVVFKFKDAKEALKIANANAYGLAAGVHTENVSRALWVANHLQAGSVWVNTYNATHYSVPFGGYGLSGIGRELGREVLANYTETKGVRIANIRKAIE